MVASDHGMTDGGNHGGASYQEADALALFISGSFPVSTSGDKMQRTGVATSSAWPSFQVDVVPTLALQLGVPIPKNSVGALLPQLFTSLSRKLLCVTFLKNDLFSSLFYFLVRLSPRAWVEGPRSTENRNEQYWSLLSSIFFTYATVLSLDCKNWEKNGIIVAGEDHAICICH